MDFRTVILGRQSVWRTGGRARGDSRHRRRRRNKVRKRLENYRRGAKKKRAIIGGKRGRERAREGGEVRRARWRGEAKALIS